MPALVAEHRHHEVGGAIHHLRAVEKGRVGIDEAAQADHLLDFVEFAERRLDLCQQVDPTGACRFLAVLEGYTFAELTFGDELTACIEADLTRDEQQRTDAHEWNVVSNGACRRGQRNAEVGKLFVDFSGNSCDGYALQFRQVSELDNGEGKVTLSDLRSTTWEDGAAKKFIFKSQNYVNETLIDSVDGQAERQRDNVAVSLTQPAAKTFGVEAGTVFPTDHMRRIIEAAREGKNILELPVYDGSEKGEKVYNTLTVIGPAIAPNERVPADAAAREPALAGLKRWPVTVSYFDRTARDDQAPVYSIRFGVYQNR